MIDYMKEPCEHNDCPNEQRLEYCEQYLDEATERIVSFAQVMDEISTARGGVSRSFSYEGDSTSSLMTRDFDYDIAPDSEAHLRVIRSQAHVRIEQHTKPRRRVYTLVDKWRVASDDKVTSPFKRTYTLELYEAGIAHATVTEPDLDPRDINTDRPRPQTYIDRPMSLYDMEQASNVLYQLQQLIRADAEYTSANPQSPMHYNG